MNKRQIIEHKKRIQGWIVDLDNAWWANKTRKFRPHKNSGRDYIRPEKDLREALGRLTLMSEKLTIHHYEPLDLGRKVSPNMSFRMIGRISLKD